MKCSKCGKNLPEDVKYCVYCGKAILMECPGCGKTILTDSEVCKFCQLNLTDYKKVIQLLKSGKELESASGGFKYEEARKIYERAAKLGVAKNKVFKLLNGATQKLRIIKAKKFDAENFLRVRKLGLAKESFLEVQKLLPKDEEIALKLELIESRIRSRAIKIRWAVIIIILLAIGVGFYSYTNSLTYLAKRGLKSLLRSEETDIRHSAILVLGEHGERAARPWLEMLANSENEQKRVCALVSLLNFGETEALPILLEIMRKGSIQASIGAAWALAATMDRTIAPELGVYLKGKNDALKISSATILLNLGYSSGIGVIEKSLENKKTATRFEGLYALYLLGSKEALQLFIPQESDLLRNLLEDPNDEIRLLSALLLNQFEPNLAKEDSVAIAQILWGEFAKREYSATEMEEISTTHPFYIAKEIIKDKGDESIMEFSPSAREIRKRCIEDLSKIELGDESVRKELEKSLTSSASDGDKYERLEAALVLFKFDKKRATRVLKELIKDKDELLKLNTCKLTLMLKQILQI
ncbi:HEAT repeat domain-containing protein [candidate division WOR-3 bacterium]|nr:HEAT repeat domain-containing protein [candidate division WOR-3 bacterium]